MGFRATLTFLKYKGFFYRIILNFAKSCSFLQKKLIEIFYVTHSSSLMNMHLLYSY